jgi:16S rRNA (cytidine1402-2'-O)-methyltransferase
VAALAASGMPTDEFLFVGFLPSRAGERRKALNQLSAQPRTLVFYEAPHRLEDTLKDALAIFGPRPAVIAREVTKLHEEFLRGTLQELLERVRSRPPRGEMTLLISPSNNQQRPTTAIPLAERVEQIMRDTNVDRKAALKQAAHERGLPKREAYKQLLKERG